MIFYSEIYAVSFYGCTSYPLGRKLSLQDLSCNSVSVCPFPSKPLDLSWFFAYDSQVGWDLSFLSAFLLPPSLTFVM